jgi:prepilin-type N-terminal cleavage/methylation domain-containing protein
MRTLKTDRQRGFSLLELVVTMVILLIIMGVISTLFSRALMVRARESRTTDALTSAYAALNVMSREISNAGFGLRNPATGYSDNGIITADSNGTQIHVRSNFTNVVSYTDPNAPGRTNEPGEDVTYYYEPVTHSIVRYDPHGLWDGTNYVPQTSVVVNKISNVSFTYYDYLVSGSTGTPVSTPSAATGRIVITVTVDLDPVPEQPNPQQVRFSSEVNLRNSNYMLQQY